MSKTIKTIPIKNINGLKTFICMYVFYSLIND